MNSYKWFWNSLKIFLLVFIQFQFVYSQKYIFNSFDVDKGLPQSQIYSLYQDTRGYLWVGTRGGGVGKFDGFNFQTFTKQDGLIDSRVIVILEAKDDKFWFGAPIGLSVYDGKSFQNYYPNDSTNFSNVTSLLQDKTGNIWVGTLNGLFKYDGKKFEVITKKDGLSNNEVKCIIEDKKGNIIVGTDGGGMFVFSNGAVLHYTTENGLLNNLVYNLLEDRDGNILINNYGKGIVIFKEGNFVYPSYNNELNSKDILSMIQDKKGNIWFGTNNKGINIFNGKNIEIIERKEGLNSIQISSLLEDREGNIWIGTMDGNALFEFTGSRFRYFDKESGLSNGPVWNIAEDKNKNLLFATYRGLDKFDGEKFTHFTTADGLSSNEVRVLLRDKNNDVWIGTTAGVCKLVNNKIYNVNLPGDDRNYLIRSFCEDKKGNIWIGTDVNGLFMYNGDVFKHFNEKNGLTNNTIITIFSDKKGTVWFATRKGLCRYNGKDFSSVKSPVIQNESILTLNEDYKGNLWLATSNVGIIIFNPEITGSGKIISSSVIKKQLLGNTGFFIAKGADSCLFIGTEKGLNKINVKSFYNSYPEVIKTYGKEDGYIGTEAIINSTYNVAEGEIWFGTIKSAILYNSNEDKINPVKPLVYIKDIKLFFGDFDWTDYCDGFDKNNLPRNLVLPYNKNYLTFNFIGLSLTVPGIMHYKFKLEGLDQKWSPVSRANSATYSNLPAGEYTVKVLSSNNDGVWNTSPASFSFTIRPPFWLTWWFYTLSFFIISLLLFTAHKSKVKILEKRQKILEETVDERTRELKDIQAKMLVLERETTERQMAGGFAHEMRNALAGAKLVLLRALGKDNESSQTSLNLANSRKLKEIYEELKKHLSEEQLDTVLKQMKTIFNNETQLEDVLRIIYTATSRGLNITDKIMSYSKLGHDSAEVNKVELNNVINDIIDENKTELQNNSIRIEKDISDSSIIFMCDETHLNSIIKNLFLNAKDALLESKNSDKVIRIAAEVIENKVVIKVSDNGIGISPQEIDKIYDAFYSTKPETGTGLGLSMVKKIISIYKGDIRVESKIGEGTSFIVELPINI